MKIYSESRNQIYPEVLSDLTEAEENYAQFDDDVHLLSAWAFRLSPAFAQRKKIMSLFDIKATIKSDFAHQYIENIKDTKNDLPWVNEIKKFPDLI